MCDESFAFWLFIVLLFTSSSTTSRNFTSDNEEDDMWEETYNHTDFIENKTNNDNRYHIVPYEKCGNITCIRICCPLGDHLVDKNCTANENEYVFPNIYSYSNNSIQSGNKKVDELFPLTVQNPCQEFRLIFFLPNYYFMYFKYMFLNGSLYIPFVDKSIESSSYCLAIVDNKFKAVICLEAVNRIIKEIDTDDDKNENTLSFLALSCRIVSMLCSLTTFVVYCILSELRNIHSFMLRIYCSLLFFGHIVEIIWVYKLNAVTTRDFSFCFIIALLKYFCFLSSSFWLSVMGFDFWWTFRDFRLLQTNQRAKQKRKKLIYSIFAWGGPFIFIIICIIMDFVPNMPENLIRPEFCVDNTWFRKHAASRLYFYGPQSVCVISSICLSIYTALKIMHYEKDTARHLGHSGSRFYNDKKRWFSLYLRLFIVLFIIIAINWIITTVHEFWVSNFITSMYVYFNIIVMETIQDISTFIIFVCKKIIMRQLLKSFCQNCKCFSKTST